MSAEALHDLLKELIKEELIEHGLLEEEKKGRKGGKGKGKKEEEKEEEPEITLETLKEKFTAYVNSEGKDEAKKILKKFKIGKLSELEEDDFEKMDELLTLEEKEDLFGDDDC